MSFELIKKKGSRRTSLGVELVNLVPVDFEVPVDNGSKFTSVLTVCYTLGQVQMV